ncbi:AI-2E family transporter [Nocardioides coralli]|uniref:AI-2E family transporter n=1 Tax=Nocardioides coralli TaxID=2872154 RepID=UPI001CA3DACC|nr:AI-2E family transporter [Nocardioides coralli]QZY28541.1 AI-2E family transporter [Nocardioides coralli]
MTTEASPPPEPEGAEEQRRRLLARFNRGQDDSLAERFVQQWAEARAERRAAPPPITAGVSNLERAQVPYGVDLAASWAWRFLVIAGAAYIVLWLLAYFAVITVPLAVALLAAALSSPAVRRLSRWGVPSGLGSLVVVLVGLGSVGLLLTFVGQQVAVGAADLADSVADGIGRISTWLQTGPLQASESQINETLQGMQEAITASTEEGGVLTRTLEVGTAVGHVVAGFFIVLFATYFFLADGERIWSWVVRLAPRAARERVDTSGRVAWGSLTKFVRATVLVAAVDAAGVMIVAAVLGVPFVLAIGVLVFLGAFVPMVGATIAGAVAVLVALVDQGPITALLMLGGVILVQQIEGHVLQPFLMGRFVSIHPLGVILAIGCGVLVAGIAGALIAVPLVAAGNAVVQHLASYTEVGSGDPERELEEDYDEVGADPPDTEGSNGDRPAES